MNLKTTLALLVLVAAGVAVLVWGIHLPHALYPPAPTRADEGSVQDLANLTPLNLVRIKVLRPDQPLQLERPPATLVQGASAWGVCVSPNASAPLVTAALLPRDPVWNMPGQWPTRTAKIQDLVQALSRLRSRFEAIPLTDENREQYRLDRPSLTVEVQTEEGKQLRLHFVEKKAEDETNRFARETYVQIESPNEEGTWQKRNELVRLGPGLLAELEKPADYYQQRRLFLSERPKDKSGNLERTERLVTKSGVTVAVKQGGNERPLAYALRYSGAEWVLTEPVQDRVDPTASTTLVTALPDLWAERFFPLDVYAATTALSLPTGGDLCCALSGLAWLNATLPSDHANSNTLSPASRWLIIRGELSTGDQFPGTDWLPVALAPLAPAGDLSSGLATVAWLSLTTPPSSGEWLLFRSGLVPTERRLTVSRPDGSTSTLLIGARSRTGSKKVTQTPPPGVPGGPREMLVPEEYRYARLLGNDQIFEVKADRLGEIFVALENLRDAKLARFNPADIRRLEVSVGGQNIVFLKDGERWKLQQPLQADADRAKVEEIVTKLSNLEVRGPDVLYQPSSQFGFDTPVATVRMIVIEEPKEGEEISPTFGADANVALLALLASPLGQNPLFAASALAPGGKPRRPRLLTWQFGTHDEDQKKLYVRTDDWPRLNFVEDSLLPLVKRPALAYRGKRVFDFNTGDVVEISIQKAALDGAREQKLSLSQKDGWKLTAPVSAAVDAAKVGQLATSLSNLEVVEFVSNEPTKEQLAEYGLEKPPLTVTVNFGDKRTPQTLQVGKARTGSIGYFARMDGSPAVFAVSEELQTSLDRDALAYLPQQLWQIPPQDVNSIRISKGALDGAREPSFELQRKDGEWRISGPFDAPALGRMSEQIATDLSAPACESYKALEVKDPAEYGLDKPYLTVTVVGKGGEHKLQLGKPVQKDSPSRFARLADDPQNPAVFTVSPGLVHTLDHAALDLLDPVVFRLPPTERLERIQSKSGSSTWTVEKQGNRWQVLETPASPFPADPETMNALQFVWLELRAERYAAYGEAVAKELEKYGLDKPTATLKIRVRKPEGTPETEEHTLELGKQVEGKGSRYARLDQKPGVAVLSPEVASKLIANYLSFVDRNVLKLDPGSITQLQKQQGTDVVEVVRQEEGWQLLKPASEKADDRAVTDLTGQLASLRASWVAAFPADDLGRYELERPLAVFTIKAGEGKANEHVIKLGKVADEGTGDRYALVDAGKAVVVLPGALANRLMASALAYRDRSLVRLREVDRVDLERGRRKVTFSQVAGSWKLVQPLAGDANQDELDDFVNLLARLRADEFVAEKPTGDDLKKYGLDRPEARWILFDANKPVLTLSIGNREKAGGRVYAKLSDKEFVFLLDTRLTEKVLGEFRPRTVWNPPLDASGIETIRFGFARSLFTLEKRGATWEVSGTPGMPVNAGTVNETLGALAGLKLVRYAQDKDADPKLYGLDTPELVLEATTRTGKRVLQIGGFEGESKRRYARVVEAGRTDVFVISETDAALLMRDLAALSKPSPLPPPGVGQ